jgi:phosphate transport system permease protein
MSVGTFSENKHMAVSQANTFNYFRRRLQNQLMLTITGISAGLSVLALLLVLYYIAVRGLQVIEIDFFLELPTPVGIAGGGISNAIMGSLIVVGLASSFSIPIGLGTGIYLSEFGRNRFADLVRYMADVLAGVPSIVMGIFAFALIVARQGHFSAMSGGFALGVMMLPHITRITEEMLNLVPNSLREAGLALGWPRWRVIVQVVIPTAIRGVLTGIVLAIARVAGETAPLLFTAFGNPFWNTNINEPIATMPHTLFVYAISPYTDWRDKAWGTALVLTFLVLLASILVRQVGARQRHI